MAKILKDTWINRIGKIPSDRKVMRVKNIFFRRKEVNTENDPVVLSLARAWVKVRDISNNEWQLAESYDNYHRVYKKDLMINPMDLYSWANCSISNVEWVISPAYINLASNKKIDARYFDYYFKNQYWVNAMFIHWKGVSFDNRWTINNDTMMNYYIPVPSYEEQKDISDLLDKICEEIDFTINGNQKEIELIKKYKTSLITKYITKWLDNKVTFKRTGVEWIWDIPNHWSLPSISYYTKSRSWGTPDRNKPEYRTDWTIPWMASWEVNKVYVYDTNEKITLLWSECSNAKILPKNSVMVALNGQWRTKWMSAILKIDATCNQSLCAFQCDNVNLYYEYLFYCFQSMYKYLRSQAWDDVRDWLAASFVKKQRIPLPPIDEQKKIVNYINEQCDKLDKVISYRQGIIDKIEDYKKSIIYEYVTGKKEVK